ncbi:MAG: EAL domain-containing protein [Steroidobacteraceae bacterium]
MSQQPVASWNPEAVQNAESKGAAAALPDLHPRLRQQLAALDGGTGDWQQCLRLISRYYEEIDAERRGIVRSMQMMAEEAHALASAPPSADASQLRTVLDHIEDVVVTVCADGTIQDCNPMGERVFGYTRGELVGVPVTVLVPELVLPGAPQRELATLEGAVAGAWSDKPAQQLGARRKNGDLFVAELVTNHVGDPQHGLHIVCLRDASERRVTEQALRDSEARYRTLVESAPEVIVLIDTHIGQFIDANENALRFFKAGRTGFVELGPLDVSAPRQANGADANTEWARRQVAALAGQPQNFEWLCRDRQGRETPVDVRLMRLPGQSGLLRASIADVSERKRAERIAACEREVFQQLAGNAALSEVLGAVVQMVESPTHQLIAGISLLAVEGQSFNEAIGANLPPRLRAVESRTLIDMRNGSAAAAVYMGSEVLVADLGQDAYWQRRRDLGLQENLRSAWAVPIKDGSGRIYGALCVYGRQVGMPADRDLELMRHAARLAGIAIQRRRSEEALRDSEAKFRGLYESVLEGVYQCAPDGRILAVNPAFVKMLGYASAEEVYALPGVSMLYWSPAERATFERQLDSAGEIHNAEHRLRRRDGVQVVVLESARVLRRGEDGVQAYEGTVADITERKRAEQAVFAEKERLQVTLQSIGDAVITTDGTGCIDYMNPVAEQLSGWSVEEVRGRAITQVLRLLDEGTRSELENPLLRCLRDGQVVNFTEQSVLVNRGGEEIAIQDSAAPIRDRAGQIVGAVVVFRDVTKERRLKRALSYQASHDALTGLINRREFDARLQTAVVGTRDSDQVHALLYVDLDQFKLVNDTCGHSAGDRLLRDVTGLLQTHVRASDTIARLGGDEFGVLVPDCSMDQAARIADNIRAAIRDYRFIWNDIATNIGASIGVVEINRDTENVAAVMSAADIACYAAKEAGRNRVHLYDSGEASGRHREMYWVGRVTRAIEEDRLELFGQPIKLVTPDAQRAPFVELLVRLRGDDGKLVPPGEFIPAAERYNVITAIDRWVVSRAVKLVRERARPDQPPPFLLALNISGGSLSERTFLDEVLALVEEPHVARCLCFEITETAVITTMSQAVTFMRELKSRGCRFALDDFGSGLSSFHYLKTLPVDFLKIDGQFVGNIPSDAVDRSMVVAISQVGRALGIATIAEKVETQEVLDLLGKLGVDYAQGYHIARPGPLLETLGRIEPLGPG